MKLGSANKFMRRVGRTLPAGRRRVHPTRRHTWLVLLLRCWRAIRRLSGDDGYERYLAHHAAAHPGAHALSRREWFAHQQHQKWAGIKRCC